MHLHGKQIVTVHTPRVPSTSLVPSLLRSCSTLSHPTSLTYQSQQSRGSYFQLYTVIRSSSRLEKNIVCSSQRTHLATELLAEQDVPCCQVPVDEPSPWEVPHTLSNLLQKVSSCFGRPSSTMVSGLGDKVWLLWSTVESNFCTCSLDTCIYSAHMYIHIINAKN